jgi:hypothetical protein
MAAKKKTQPAAPSQADPRAPLDTAAFLSAAQRVLAVLRDDLLTRADQSPGVTAALKAQWEVEREAKRTGDPWEVWRRRVVVQVAAAWVLSLVFARTLEDRGLLERNRIAGPGATDSQEQFRGIAPYLSDRDYLLTVFQELSNLPAAKDLFDPAHNPVWKLGPSIDGARALLDLFRAPDPEAPAFRFGQADTRFLGDLYQSLDEETQERFALLQTPHFVEAYILDRTLERAIARFGLHDTTLIDPTCGSGHFLLGAFERFVDHRLRKEPGLDVREAARRAIDAVYGADINPYAVAIARFRLTLAFLERGGYGRLAEAPALPLHLVVGDSLLHAPLQAHLGDVAGTSKEAWAGREFALEDEDAAKDVLLRRYAAVVGNPPYITVKDAVLRERYREMYPRSAARTYSLGAPFTERFFLLARTTGFVGMITANSFMKREFGKKLIEEFLPNVNLDGVVNTSGAYIPGHGTPTVLLFGTNEPKQGSDVPTVLAKRGEPSTPDDPARGLVWSSIAEHGDEVGFENDNISVARVSRATLEKHPWSLGGGGAAELKELIEERATLRLADIIDGIGRTNVVGEDDVWIADRGSLERRGVADLAVPFVIGESVRDWAILDPPYAIYPYDAIGGMTVPATHHVVRALWPWRALLERRTVFGKQMKEHGRPWWEHLEHYRDKLRAPLSIAFPFVATHNHFVLDRGGKVFKQTAPIIKLKEGATEDDHLALLAYLNSSTACFWMKQVMMDKGATSDRGVLQASPEKFRFEFDGTKMATVPVPPNLGTYRAGLVVEYGRRLSAAGEDLAKSPFEALIVQSSPREAPHRIAAVVAERDSVRGKMVGLQEELDWLFYELLGLLPSDDEARASQTPEDVRGREPDDRAYRQSHADPVRARAIASNAEIALIERPEFKRRWFRSAGAFDAENTTDEMRAKAAAWNVIARSLEESFDVAEPVPVSSLVLSSTQKSSVLSAATVLERELDGPLILTALDAETVPFLAAYRHTEAGLEKRAAWERVWSLQRAEDRGEKVAPFDPPPKYDQKDYRDATTWRLRGKLDVPKERFIRYPGCESDEDKEPVYGWAGWNRLQQAIALATLYLKRKQGEAWGKDRLIPMLAGLDELLPWIWQWHPDPTPESGGVKPGQYVADFLSAQCQELGVTLDELRAWRPDGPKRNGAGAAKKARAPRKAKASTEEEETQ